MITHCLTCNALLFREHRGRPRQYCSDAYRYAEVARRKAQRPAPAKPSHCAICGGSIVQPATGRPRQSCTTCQAPRKLVQKSTKALLRR